MKTIYLSIALITLSAVSASAQKRNRFDTSYARPHELSVSVGTFMNNGGFPFGRYNDSRGPNFSVQYARVYRFNHFLRAGLGAGVGDMSYRPYHYFPAEPTSGDNQPDNYTTQKLAIRHNAMNTHAWAFVGYEYGVGVRRFRFTFGADLSFGYHGRRINMREDRYQETRTYNPLTGMYAYNLQFLYTGRVVGKSNNIYASVTPRIGIRRELGRRMALAFTFTPRIGYTERLGYTETVSGVKPSRYFNPKSAWFVDQGGEIRLIVKLGRYD